MKYLCLYLVIFFSCCKVSHYNDNRLFIEDNRNFICENNTCVRGIIPDESCMNITLKEQTIKNNKIKIAGSIIDESTKEVVPYCEIYLGKEIHEEIVLEKLLTLNNEHDGSFRLNSRLDSYDLVIFTSLGYRPRIFKINK